MAKKKLTIYLRGRCKWRCLQRFILTAKKNIKAATQMTGDGGFHVHLSGDPSTFQPEATYTLRSKHTLKIWRNSLLQKGSTWCHYLFKYLLPSMEIIFVPVCLVTWLTRFQTVSQDSSLLQKTQTVASKLFLQAAHFCSSKSFLFQIEQRFWVIRSFPAAWRCAHKVF